jgi:dTDP-glucose 4,6-dehydratase
VILVTGGAGFLGYHLVRALIRERPAARVVILDDLSTPGSAQRAQRLVADGVQLLQEDLLLAGGRTGHGLPRLDLAEIWHLASPASPPLYKARAVDTLRLGGEALDTLLSLARAHEARLVFASTSEIYGDPDVHPQPESYPGRVHCDGPRSCYDEAKRYGEALCAAWRSRGVDGRVVRIFNTYGPNIDPEDGRLLPRLLWSAASGAPFPLHGDGSQRRTLAYVDDTIAGMLTVARAVRVPGPVNVGSDLDAEISVLDLVALVRGLPEAQPFEVRASPRQDPHDPQRRCPDLARLRTLGWEPRVRLVDGLSRTLRWLLAQR